MGTHGKGPSIVVGEDSKPLKDWIQSNPECLGDKVRSKFNDQLPFLFKVLSVNKALSIQAHPHKVRLHNGDEERRVTCLTASFFSSPAKTFSKQVAVFVFLAGLS